ncbi:MAG: Gfo/Idh/MocA family oxidoreductase [Acidimicrobiia bacterium]|nr:Gfo/Idh/MocA family oxidoreductase [Acidimicrobiia bacterium]
MMRIGLAGCGLIGSVHAYALQQLAENGLVEAELASTFDTDRERAERVARSHGGRAVGSLDELLDGVDVVWICTWTAGHLEAVEAAAERGLPVFCEKPLAPTLDLCERAAAALERVPHQVGLVLRWSPVFAEMGRIIESGRYGRPLATIMRDDQYFPIQGMYGSTWRAEASLAGGGTLIEHSIHDIDVLRWLLGDPVSVSASTAATFGHAGIENVAALTLAYEGGSTATLVSVWHQILSRESSRRLEVFCEDALLFTEDDYLGPLHIQTSDGLEIVEGRRPSGSPPSRFPRSSGTPSPTTPRRARRSSTTLPPAAARRGGIRRRRRPWQHTAWWMPRTAPRRPAGPRLPMLGEPGAPARCGGRVPRC